MKRIRFIKALYVVVIMAIIFSLKVQAYATYAPVNEYEYINAEDTIDTLCTEIFDDHKPKNLADMMERIDSTDTSEKDNTKRNNTKSLLKSENSSTATVKHIGRFKEIEWTIYDNGLLEVSGKGEYKLTDPTDGTVYSAPWYKYSDEITYAVIDVRNTTDFSEMFWKCHNLEKVEFKNTATLYPKTMAGMFADCLKLKEIEWGPMNTYNLRSMSAMFNYCKSIEKIDLSNFDTSAVQSMSTMFLDCNKLESIDFGSKFKTNNVQNMSLMFYGCYILKNIDIKEFNTENVTNMSYMFAGCMNLEKLEFGPQFITAKVSNMESMFAACKKIKELKLANFNCSNIPVGNTDSMLYQCDSLTTVFSPNIMGKSSIELYMANQDKSLYKWVKRGEKSEIRYISTKLTNTTIYDKVLRYDYWDKFANYDKYFEKYGSLYFISDDDYSRLNSSLSPRDCLAVLGPMECNYYHPSEDGMVGKTPWTGSCFGMSAWVALQNNGWLNLGKDLCGTEFDDDIMSKINYYHFQQYLWKNKVDTVRFAFKQPANKIIDLKRALESGKVSLISYYYLTPFNENLGVTNSMHSHTVCGLSLRYVSSGEKTETGIDVSNYTYCAMVYDPNFSTISQNSNYNIYFNDDGTFYIPGYNIRCELDSKDYLRMLLCVSVDKGYVNGVDYYTGIVSESDTSDITNRFFTLDLGIEYKIKWSNEEINIDKNGMVIEDNPNVFVFPNSDTSEGELGTITVCLPNVQVCSVMADEGFEAYELGQYYTTYANIEEGGEIIFRNDGSAFIDSKKNTNKMIHIGINDGFIENPWNYMSASSKEGSKLSVEVLENKAIIEADDLTDAIIKLSNEYNEDDEPIVLPQNATRAEFSKGADGVIIEHNGDIIDDGNDDHQITDRYRTSFVITDNWEGGYNALIRIENISEENIDNWTLAFDYDGEISNVWNAEILSHDGSKYTIKNVGWNQDIAPGQTIEIGLSGQENFVAEPTDYALISGLNEGNTNDFSVSIQIYDDWGSGCNGNMTITNNSDTTIEDWGLEFDFDAELTSIWNAEIVGHEGAHYIIKNAQHNSNIEPGQSVSVGFNGGEGAGSTELRGYKLYSYGL